MNYLSIRKGGKGSEKEMVEPVKLSPGPAHPQQDQQLQSPPAPRLCLLLLARVSKKAKRAVWQDESEVAEPKLPGFSPEPQTDNKGTQKTPKPRKKAVFVPQELMRSDGMKSPCPSSPQNPSH